ncbi:MAG TPA: hypothetical protein VFK94_01815 [Patescibacteria group bacterium]|nr:hypothetical protein [Patescibacteria group bacterium]
MGYSPRKKAPTHNSMHKGKTMLDSIFATFLYAAMICFVCCLRYQPSSAATIPTDIANLPTLEPQPASLNQVLTTEPEQKPEVTDELIEEVLADEGCSYKPAQINQPDVEAVELVEPKSVKTVGTLNHSKLTVRQCRAVIREINKGLPKQDRIRQKLNGKDAPADWLRSQIVRYLEAHPSISIAVEELLKVG